MKAVVSSFETQDRLYMKSNQEVRELKGPPNCGLMALIYHGTQIYIIEVIEPDVLYPEMKLPDQALMAVIRPLAE